MIIEHNLDIIKYADRIINMGSEDDNKGGQLIFEGSLSDFLKCEASYTRRYLRKTVQFGR
jgi:excinuclease ABC subunit A